MLANRAQYIQLTLAQLDYVLEDRTVGELAGDYLYFAEQSVRANGSTSALILTVRVAIQKELERRRYSIRVGKDWIEIYKSQYLLAYRSLDGKSAWMRTTPHHLMNRIFWRLRWSEVEAISIGDAERAGDYRRAMLLLLKQWSVYRISDETSSIDFRVAPGWGGTIEYETRRFAHATPTSKANG